MGRREPQPYECHFPSGSRWSMVRVQVRGWYLRHFRGDR